MGATMARPQRTRNDLARVIRERLDELREQGMNAERVAARCLPPLAGDYLSRVASGMIHQPDMTRLAALAVGLEMPVHDLQEATFRPAREQTPASPLPRSVAAATALSSSGAVSSEVMAQVDAEFAAELERLAIGAPVVPEIEER